MLVEALSDSAATVSGFETTGLESTETKIQMEMVHDAYLMSED